MICKLHSLGGNRSTTYSVSLCVYASELLLEFRSPVPVLAKSELDHICSSLSLPS